MSDNETHKSPGALDKMLEHVRQLILKEEPYIILTKNTPWNYTVTWDQKRRKTDGRSKIHQHGIKTALA